MKLNIPNFLLLITFILSTEASALSKDKAYTNRLINEKSPLYVSHSIEETSKKFKENPKVTRDILQKAKGKLFVVSSKRLRPHLDDKILTDWNGLMISSLAVGSLVLNEPRYRKSAEKAAQFILKQLATEDGRLLHRYRKGESAILGMLEDYAFFIHGLLRDCDC